MKSILLIIILFQIIFNDAYPQRLQKISKKGKVSLRGLSVLSDDCFWVSGSKGTVGLKLPASKKIKWQQVPGFENRDFRDIAAFNDSTAIIMAIGNPAVILRTTNAGANWTTVYEKEDPDMFLDALSFKGDEGRCIGDPVDGRFWLLQSFDAGENWEECPQLLRPEAIAGEALFAASGSNLQFIPYDSTSKWRRPEPFTWGFITGGNVSRLFLMTDNPLRPPEIINLPILQGQNSLGANSWAVNGNKWAIAGGDYKNIKQEGANHFYTVNEGQNWSPLKANGYKSSICWMDSENLIACGTSGVSMGKTNAETWIILSKKAFHVVTKAEQGKTAILAGPKGRVYRLIP